jgi:UDP-2,3-diacylglucosamine pyrophosphatase LpxH
LTKTGLSQPRLPLNPKKVVVTSDQHLGYANSDKESFKLFLYQIQQDPTVTDLVLLGDVVDMWRRDASGLFIENWDILEIIMAMRNKLNVHYVAGNHDYHVLQLLNHKYPFTFLKDLTINDGNWTYKFLHGYEFDPEQEPSIMEALCRVMSDEVGNFESGAWATLTRDWSDIKYFLSSILPFEKNRIREKTTHLQLNPELRLQNTIGLVEKRACASVQPGEILVFGHTHKPFVNTKENVANSGSWVTDAPTHNTYVELTEGKPRLLRFGGGEIIERYEC